MDDFYLFGNVLFPLYNYNFFGDVFITIWDKLFFFMKNYLVFGDANISGVSQYNILILESWK